MARVRNNQGHRAKILNVFMRPYLEQEHTQEKEAFDQEIGRASCRERV